MVLNSRMSERELRECYNLLSKEELIEALIRKHKEHQNIGMPSTLTAENGAKGLLMGEFFENREIRFYNEDGVLIEHTEKVPVSWSTIKDIYSKIVSHYKDK